MTLRQRIQAGKRINLSRIRLPIDMNRADLSHTDLGVVGGTHLNGANLQGVKLLNEQSEIWSVVMQSVPSGLKIRSAIKFGTKKPVAPPVYVRDYVMTTPLNIITDESALEFLRESSVVHGKLFVFTIGIDVPGEVAHERKWGKEPHLDWDDASYAGDGEDGVYYGAMHTKKGKWWALTTVDSNSGGVTQTLDNIPGHKSEKDALEHAKYVARDWCYENNVKMDEKES